MDREDQRRYFVVGSVFMEIVTPLFRKKVENDYTNKGFGSFHAFINSQSVKHILFHLRHRNTCCCQDQVHCFNSRALPVNYSQWDLLYTENPGPGPHNCHCKFTANQIQLDDLDITLASLILLNCCNLGQQDENIVGQLRQYKNDYLSHNTKGQITETEYHTLWTDLESFILQLDPSKEDDLIRLQQRPLDQQLCDKYLICLLDLHKKLDEQELLAWKEITDLDKKKQGVVIALSLPEDDESKIREKEFDQISLDDLKKDTGLTTLITFMDKHLAKDDLADSLAKFGF
ncbi:unnamed protein product [Mytilus coruscus]|uniref:DZIP3-like HEPN domain-containing protein n=1 Tax=Mytilus coruscus TaxID=42192 RepID=A0A6J8BD56_MYTCO|nr:unnamed protein product [Mytilus coruscus]